MYIMLPNPETMDMVKIRNVKVLEANLDGIYRASGDGWSGCVNGTVCKLYNDDDTPADPASVLQSSNEMMAALQILLGGGAGG